MGRLQFFFSAKVMFWISRARVTVARGASALRSRWTVRERRRVHHGDPSQVSALATPSSPRTPPSPPASPLADVLGGRGGLGVRNARPHESHRCMIAYRADRCCTTRRETLFTPLIRMHPRVRSVVFGPTMDVKERVVLFHTHSVDHGAAPAMSVHPRWDAPLERIIIR